MSDRVTLSVTGGIADVRLNRPDKRNALDPAMFAGIVEMGERLKTEPGVRAVVLSGEGASFCAGLDFSSFRAMGDSPREADAGEPEQRSTDDGLNGRITHQGQQCAWVWQEVPAPVIAAVHGHALGGGIQIMLGADIRVVHPDTKISVREVHWGLVPDMTGTLTLSRLVGVDVAKELTFTAKMISGAEAAEIGLATHLSDNPRADAMALAAEIASRSPEAVRGAKQLFNRLANADAAEQFAAERQVIGSLFSTPNQVEAIKAGMDGRDADFADV
ncbi:MAG: crotonase/enoyl-CoA hydratase family protein [Acidimicrobiia bacterium]|nr:crotonase/enoyl-CoA hydratase family protein [Acidimicrobiia bacterium]